MSSIPERLSRLALLLVILSALARVGAAQPSDAARSAETGSTDAPRPDPLAARPFATLHAGVEQALADQLPGALAAPVTAPPEQALGLLGASSPTAEATAPGSGPTFGPEAPLLRARRDALRRDIGLDLRSTVLENGTAATDDDGARYRRRASLEIGWDLLGEGLFDRRMEARELELELTASALEADASRADRMHGDRFAAIIAHFNREKAVVLDARLDALAALIELTEALYRTDYVGWDRLSGYTTARARAEVHRASVGAFNRRVREAARPAGSETPRWMPVFAVDEAMLEAPGGTDAEHLALELDRLRLREHPLRDVRLRSFVRYNLYHSPADASPVRDFVSAGVSFSMPLRWPGGPTTADAVRARAARLQDEAARAARRELAVELYEYDYTLQQYVGMRGQERTLRHRLSLALEARRLGAAAYSGVEALATLEQLHAVRFELLDLQQKLYLQLLDIGRRVGVERLAHALVPLEDDDPAARREARLSAYLWSDTFAEHAPGALVGHLRRAGVESIYLSPGALPARGERVRALVDAAREQGIETHLLLGTPVVVHPERYARIDRLVADARAVGAAGVHLDVEPHTFDDWHAREAEYLDRYLAMARHASRAARRAGLEVGFAVSPQYPDTLVRRVAALADDVVLMAYGPTAARDVPASVDATLALAPATLRLGVRPADFASAEALRRFVEERLAHADGRFALHDVEALLALSPSSPPSR